MEIKLNQVIWFVTIFNAHLDDFPLQKKRTVFRTCILPVKYHTIVNEQAHILFTIVVTSLKYAF